VRVELFAMHRDARAACARSRQFYLRAWQIRRVVTRATTRREKSLVCGKTERPGVPGRFAERVPR
jgi:hypothetical protein